MIPLEWFLPVTIAAWAVMIAAAVQIRRHTNTDR